MLQVARERRLRKASEQAAQAAADAVDAERQRQAARAAQEATFLHLKVLLKLLWALLMVPAAAVCHHTIQACLACS